MAVRKYNNLEFLGASYRLKFNYNKYANNNRLYIGLETKEGPFCDLTVNIDEKYGVELDRLKGCQTKKGVEIPVEGVAIDNNFISIFGSWKDCREWLLNSTIKDSILITGNTMDEYYHIVYFRKDKLPI